MELLGWFRKVFTSGVSVPDALNYTPRARKVLEMAAEGAKRENREKPSVGDVAVALAEFNTGVAAEVLKRFQTSLKGARFQ